MKRVLIVDDNEQNRYLLRVLLEGHGFEVEEAIDGEDALAHALQAPPDAIVTDILMPNMDGLTLCRAWRADPELRQIPFIVYTATYTDARDRDLALTLGVDRFIVKPEDPAHFVSVVRDAINDHQNERSAEQALSVDDAVVLKEYNEALIRKLEDKMEQLEREVTQRKKAEAENRRLMTQLERRVEARTRDLQQAYREMETFSYSVSHDLGAPVSAVRELAQQLLNQDTGRFDAQDHDRLQRIRTTTERMADMIQNLLTLSRVAFQDVQHEQVDLSRLVAEILSDLQRDHPDRRVETLIAPGVVTSGDVRLLRIALENLLGNAWKFTSKVPIARIEFGATERDGRAAFFIRDNGAGFDMAGAYKLFVPFQRLHSTDEFSGSGIGLATAQRVVHRHGGQIWAEGAANQGATVTFTLSPFQEIGQESGTEGRGLGTVSDRGVMA